MNNWVKAMLIVFGHITLAIASIAGVIFVAIEYPTVVCWIIFSIPCLIGLFVWIDDTKKSLDRQQNGKKP
jgi:hypothetical protein